MARPTGRRNADYEEKRQALIASLASYVLSDGVALPSYRQLAIAAGTSQPTLTHYFGDRQGVILAIVKAMRDRSNGVRQTMRLPSDTVAEAVRDYADLVAQISRPGEYLNGHIFALRESLADKKVFEVYARLHIEPSIEALAERLVKSKGGPTNFATARKAAKMMISSALLLALRQDLLRDDDPVPSNFAAEFKDMAYWLSLGIEADPELEEKPLQSATS